jgi:hypothetical protein
MTGRNFVNPAYLSTGNDRERDHVLRVAGRP